MFSFKSMTKLEDLTVCSDVTRLSFYFVWIPPIAIHFNSVVDPDPGSDAF
jgi:hypothetical protein